MISENLANLQGQVRKICERIGRDPQEIMLVGVTKYSDISEIIQALQAGLECIGENRVQDAKAKFPAIEKQGFHPQKHLIGHLQTNKVKDALKLFDLIQSVDSIKLVEALETQATKQDTAAKILIQVNTSGEEQKHGVSPDEIDGLLDKVKAAHHMEVLGLMTMAPLTEDKEAIRSCFRDLRHLYDKIKESNQHDKISMKYLSMGMSGDFDIALEEGANMLRIGSAIFKGQGFDLSNP